MVDTPDPVDRAVGARIRVRRVALKMSQTTLANALGRTFQQVQKYETGANRVSASALLKISEALECSVSYLIGENEVRGEPTLAEQLPPDAIDLVEAYAKVTGKQQRQAILNLTRALAA